jgi:ABC-type uncharacterized transport system permease subunit
MKHKLIDKIASYIFYFSILLLIIVNFIPFEIKIKQIIAPVAITLFGLSLVIVLLRGFFDLKLRDFDYFRNVLIGIFGGLTVWFFSTIDFSFPNGIMLGINDILVKLGFGMMILLIGYKIVGRKKDEK